VRVLGRVGPPLYNPDGTAPQGQEFQVNETVNQPQRFPAVGMDAATRFAIAWQAINQDASSWGVYQRQYNAARVPVTGEEQVNTQTQGPQIHPAFALTRGVADRPPHDQATRRPATHAGAACSQGGRLNQGGFDAPVTAEGLGRGSSAGDGGHGGVVGRGAGAPTRTS
jgi:hypothetical protein